MFQSKYVDNDDSDVVAHYEGKFGQITRFFNYFV